MYDIGVIQESLNILANWLAKNQCDWTLAIINVQSQFILAKMLHKMGFLQFQDSTLFYIEATTFHGYYIHGNLKYDAPMGFDYEPFREALEPIEDDLIYNILICNEAGVKGNLTAGADSVGCHALHWAAIVSCTRVIELLLAHNRHAVNLMNKRGETALSVAVMSKAKTVLLQHGADPTLSGTYIAYCQHELYTYNKNLEEYMMLMEAAYTNAMNWRRRRAFILVTLGQFAVLKEKSSVTAARRLSWQCQLKPNLFRDLRMIQSIPYFLLLLYSQCLQEVKECHQNDLLVRAAHRVEQGTARQRFLENADAVRHAAQYL